MTIGRPPRDLTGQRFGKLVVLSRDQTFSRPAWRCRCDCGNEAVVVGQELTRTNRPSTRSCGCLRVEASRTHGQAVSGQKTPEYWSWRAMMERCYYVDHVAYPHYGARGITVCARWHDLANFVADMGPRPSGLTLDRVENDKDYEPGNCKWSTRKEQRHNQRPDPRQITFNGETKSHRQWANHLGISRPALAFRLKNWTIEKAMTTPKSGGET